MGCDGWGAHRIRFRIDPMKHTAIEKAAHRAPIVARAPHTGLALSILLCAVLSYACRPEGPEDEAPTGPPSATTVSVTLEWDPPSTDAAGDPLDDLAGYRLYFGTSTPLAVARDTFVDVGMSTSFTLVGLEPGTWYFATTAIDESGNESALSAELRADLTP